MSTHSLTHSLAHSLTHSYYHEVLVAVSPQIHQKEDDLGLGGNAGSRTTGNAGSRLGCCIIRADNGVSFRQINAPLMALCIAALFKIHRGTTT